MKKKGTLIAGGLLVLVCVLAGMIAVKFKPETVAGAKEVTIVVVHGDGKETEFTYQTDAEYLVDVLLDNELVDGEDGAYGLYITAVDGEAADDSRQQWWCITKAGEQLNTSADTTPIKDGEQYELTLKEGY
ncbi:MAG: DUF4430 domain-containing protein [Lachnospiraceae bacterium]|nr:DUF4430 domain-containing protein [Lachnospiraceae bacterium]